MRIFPYFFGVYHWRTRSKRILQALLLGVVALLLSRSRSTWYRAVGFLGVGWAGRRGIGAVDALCSPPPWVVERYKYEALAETLPTGGTERWLDVGCGTGRSLVGVSDLVPEDCHVLGVDVFDDRIVLGNAPELAARNARKAGLAVSAIYGDATRLPVAEDSQHVVTACRLLHDLSREQADETLSELRRVCAPGGAVGILEIPITHDGATDPPSAYWPAIVEEAGLTIERVREVPRRHSDDAYVVVVARP